MCCMLPIFTNCFIKLFMEKAGLAYNEDYKWKKRVSVARHKSPLTQMALILFLSYFFRASADHSFIFSSLGIAKEFLTSLPNKDHISWSNIDPHAVIEELGEVLDLDNLNNFFHRVCSFFLV